MVSVNNDRERIYSIAVDQYIELGKRCRLESLKAIVKRRIPAARGLQPIEEIQHDLGHGDVVDNLDLLTKKLQIHLRTAFLDTQGDNRPQIILRCQYRASRNGLSHALDITQIGQL